MYKLLCSTFDFVSHSTFSSRHPSTLTFTVIRAIHTFMIPARDQRKVASRELVNTYRRADNKPSIVHVCRRLFCVIATRTGRDGTRKNYPREVPRRYQLREHRRRSLSAMRGGDSDAREEHHDIHTGESVRSGPSRYNNVTPGLARAWPGRCTPHRRRANAVRYAIVNPHPSPSCHRCRRRPVARRRRMGGMGAMGGIQPPWLRFAWSRPAHRPTRERRGERAREGAKVALPRGRNSHAFLPHFEVTERVSVDESDRGTAARRADWPRSRLELVRRRELSLSRLSFSRRRRRRGRREGERGSDAGPRGGSYSVRMLTLICKKMIRITCVYHRYY